MRRERREEGSSLEEGEKRVLLTGRSGYVLSVALYFVFVDFGFETLWRAEVL